MAVPQHRRRLMSIQELLEVQRDSSPTRCARCHGDPHELATAALRARIRVLEARVAELEAWLCGLS